jgi:hypothetical protein
LEAGWTVTDFSHARVPLHGNVLAAVLSNRSRTRIARRAGKHGEAVAERVLAVYKLKQIVRIETGWRIIRNGFGKIVDAVPIAKVPGDFRAIEDGGRSVLVEVKERDDKLIWSDLDQHQHDALAEHARHGGLSLIVWVCPSDHAAFLLGYNPPFRLFKRGPPITADEARTISLMWINL